MLIIKIKPEAGIKISLGDKDVFVKNMGSFNTRFGIKAEKDILITRIERENEHISDKQE